MTWSAFWSAVIGALATNLVWYGANYIHLWQVERRALKALEKQMANVKTVPRGDFKQSKEIDL